ncbi:MAG: hypothetical protein IJR88_03240 [Clostridia bacterium]|nr:hypothetical protein [Clostridia bacterium]
MDFDRMNKNGLWSRLFTLLLGLTFGLLLWLVNADALVRFVFTFFGLFVMISGIPGLVAGIASFDSKEGKWIALVSALTIAMGLVLIFYHGMLLLILLGIFLLLSPILEIVFAKNKWAAVRKNLYKWILGAVLILLGPAQTLDLFFDVAGWTLMALSVVSFFISSIRLNKKKNTPGNRIFADTTGDGEIDTVFVDTTGDGKADTATDYRNRKR